jgi:HK97 gp10 family phage protein
LSNRAGFSVKVEIKGLDGVVEKMHDLGPKLARKGLRKALNAVGSYWIPEVKSRVPVLSGDLRNSIIKAVKTKKDKNGEVSGTVWVGPAMNAQRTDDRDSVGPGIYGMWVEFGLKRKSYPAHPFMRPTLDATGDKAVQLFADTLKDVLEDIAKKQ